MLFERRAYTLRAGAADRFWDLQRRWNTPASVPRYLERCVCYLQTVAAASEQIVHLYRYDSFDDWKSRLFGIYTADRNEYFVEARKLLSAQEDAFLALSPLSNASPIWNDNSDWLPGKPAFRIASEIENVIVVEETIDMTPGGLPLFYELTSGFVDETDGHEAAELIATFTTLVGRQHRVLRYSWYPDMSTVQRHHAGQWKCEAWRQFQQALRPICVGRRISLLKLAPIPWMRQLFSD